jgi:hypothetical protein
LSKQVGSGLSLTSGLALQRSTNHKSLKVQSSTPALRTAKARTARAIRAAFGACVALLACSAWPGPDPAGAGAPAEAQPLIAQVKRVVEAMRYLGSPLSAGDEQVIEAALRKPDGAAASESVQRILDSYCLFRVRINPEERVSVSMGPVRPELVESGWRQFLVRVDNEAGATAALAAVSPNARSVFSGAQRGGVPTDSDKALSGPGGPPPGPAYDRWLDMRMIDSAPLARELSGLGVEYRIIQLYSRDSGRREARITFSVGQGTQDIGYGDDANVVFDCRPAHKVTLRIRDEDGGPTTASLLIRDLARRVYPSQAKRLAPDFAFQPQIYRADGDVLSLPEGEYSVHFRRGPESLAQDLDLRVGSDTREWSFQVRRWIDPSRLGWWSGDHHIHAAGCAHYSDPTEGVLPADMELQCRGEDLKVGSVLTWGPCFAYQKQFFSGRRDNGASVYPYLLHYDIEVSGFGSEASGHLCLLQLREEAYPGTDSTAHWPTYCLKTLRWAKAQGAVTGTAHSGWGLQPAETGESVAAFSSNSNEVGVQTEALPNYIIPPYNGIGANEYVVDVTHEVPGPDGKPVPAVDFYSAADTPYVWEMNMWYHTLNCGFRTRLSGETDFPCIYMERVGMGRTYVKLDGPLTYAEWCEGLRTGRSYVSDGKSHLINFAVDRVGVGEADSEVRLERPGHVRATVRAAARLAEEPDPELRGRSMQEEPYWDIERARIGNTRKVPVEVVVNGEPVARQEVIADGQIRDLVFDVAIERSSWVALRIPASSHTNPIFVIVGNKPIRASRRSAEWCLRGVDRCWSQKERSIAASEKDEAAAAYEHARQVYRRRIEESDVE